MYLEPSDAFLEEQALFDALLQEAPEPTGKFLGRLDHFVAHETALLPHHSFKLAEIARDISRSFAAGKPIRCVQIIGHSATWMGISPAEYARRARQRAQNAATVLVHRLAEVHLTAKVLEEEELQGPDGRPRCQTSALVDVKLYVGDRADSQKLVPNLTQDNRARNRRVEFFAYHAKKKKKPPTPKKKTKVGYCLRRCGSQGPLLHQKVRRSIRAARKARERLERLSAMSPADREKAWNNGQEKIWFGPYKRAFKKVPFAYVKRIIDRIWYVFRGEQKNAEHPCSDRKNHLTIECFDCSGVPRSDEICLNLDRENAPGKRWCRAAPTDRLKTEKRIDELVFRCCEDEETVGFSYFCNPREILNPMRRKPMPRPHKIGLGPAFFKRPKEYNRAEWLKERELTIVHEVAHLAGAIRLFGERYGEKRAKRLARLNPWGARVNADNYAHYIMEFAP